jgi:WD repeat-containing protein 35
VSHYKTANYYEGLIEAYVRLEDYDSLDKLANELPEGSPMLNELGEKF